MEYCKKHGSFIKWRRKKSITDAVECPRCLKDCIKELEERIVQQEGLFKQKDNLHKIHTELLENKLKRAEDILIWITKYKFSNVMAREEMELYHKFVDKIEDYFNKE